MHHACKPRTVNGDGQVPEADVARAAVLEHAGDEEGGEHGDKACVNAAKPSC